MFKRLLIISAMAIACLLSQTHESRLHAQDFPIKPVKIITQGAPGSAPDIVARIVFNQLAEKWGHQPIIINAPGAGGSTAARQAVAAAPDGYTLYMPSASAVILMPSMFRQLPFDINRDFVPIGIVAEQPLFVAVAASLGIGTLSELIALTKKSPGVHNYAAGGRGTLPHLIGERFRQESGADLTFIPYSGIGAGLQDLLGGRISIVVEGSGIIGAAQDKAAHLLATTASERLREIPSLPTVSETIPGFVATGWFALMAPAGVSDALVLKINRDLGEALNTPDVRSKLGKFYAYTRVLSVGETATFLRTEQQAWQPIVAKIGLQPQ